MYTLLTANYQLMERYTYIMQRAIQTAEWRTRQYYWEIV